MDILVILWSSASQGVLWTFLAIGVFLTYRILDIADLTTEGSFPLGAAVAAVAILHQLPPLVATLLGFGAGMLAGLISGLLYTKLKIPALLAGIITMTGLYSINARIMGSANLALLGEASVFDLGQQLGLSKTSSVFVTGCLILALIILLLVLFLKTELGLALRATGDNPDMSAANGVSVDNVRIIGYMLSNGCIALSGALLAQNNGFADLNSGVGTIVIGLAAIIIAEVLFAHKTLPLRFGTLLVGTILYRFILACVLELGVAPTDLKLFSALILIICLSLPLTKSKLKALGKGARA